MPSLEDRRRRANRLGSAALLCIPLLVLVAMVAVTPRYLDYLGDSDGGTDVVLGVLTIVVAAALGFGYAVARGFRRTRSPLVAATAGVFQGVVGALVPTNMLDVTAEDSNAVPIGLAVFAVVGAVLPWWLARASRDARWGSVDDALIDSDDEVVVAARGIGKLALSVGEVQITLKRRGTNGFVVPEELADVQSVSVARSLNDERRDVTGLGDVLDVRPGGAVRVRFGRGEWFVPVTDPDGVARLITRRAERAAAVRARLGDETDEHEWYARRNRMVVLTVDQETMALSVRSKHFAAMDLYDLVSATVIRIAADETRDLTGEGAEVAVTAGEAVRLRFDDDTEWVFPVDKAQEIATLITEWADRCKANG